MADFGWINLAPGELRIPVCFSIQLQGGHYFDFASNAFSHRPRRPLAEASRILNSDGHARGFSARVPSFPSGVLVVVAYQLDPDEAAAVLEPDLIPWDRFLGHWFFDWPRPAAERARILPRWSITDAAARAEVADW